MIMAKAVAPLSIVSVKKIYILKDIAEFRRGGNICNWKDQKNYLCPWDITNKRGRGGGNIFYHNLREISFGVCLYTLFESFFHQGHIHLMPHSCWKSLLQQPLTIFFFFLSNNILTDNYWIDLSETWIDQSQFTVQPNK